MPQGHRCQAHWQAQQVVLTKGCHSQGVCVWYMCVCVVRLPAIVCCVAPLCSLKAQGLLCCVLGQQDGHDACVSMLLRASQKHQVHRAHIILCLVLKGSMEQSVPLLTREHS